MTYKKQDVYQGRKKRLLYVKKRTYCVFGKRETSSRIWNIANTGKLFSKNYN